MKKDTFKQRKIGKQLVSVMMLGLTISPIVLQTHSVLAQDSVTVHLTSNEATKTTDVPLSETLKKAIDDAKAAGYEVKAGQTVTVKSQTEADKIFADNASKMQAAQKDYQSKEAAYKKYETAKATYDKQMATYNEALKQAEANKDKDGYLSKVASQSLIFTSEPNAKTALSGKFTAYKAKNDDPAMSFLSTKGRDIVGKSTQPVLSTNVGIATSAGEQRGKDGYNLSANEGDTFTVTYTNLENTEFSGKKISKVTYDYTVVNSPASDKSMNFFIYTDPTHTVYIGAENDDNSNTDVKLVAKFYDESGKQIAFSKDQTPIISASSLNATPDLGEHEYMSIKNTPNATFVGISGSSVTGEDGLIYSRKSNEPRGEWDSKDNDRFWYGSGAVELTGGNEVAVNFGAILNRNLLTKENFRGYVRQWFAFNADVTATDVPRRPSLTTQSVTKPVKPTLEYNPVKLEVDVPETPVETPKTPVKTTWVDEDGNPLKDPKEGTFPDKEGDDVPGYKFVETKTDDNGNVTNVYKPLMTNWVDEDGKPLQDPKQGTFPDKEGDDIKDYTFVETKTDDDGNVTNVYRKPKTHWVDTNGKVLQDPKDGLLPDDEGDDIKDYIFVETKDEDNGDITNVYKPVMTEWVDEDGNPLQDPKEGSHPDDEGDDIKGYKFVDTEIDDDGNVTNIYQKIVNTQWVDEDGKPLQDPKEGAFPDDEGDDIPGYELVETKTEDGNIINVYRNLPAETPTPDEPETPAPSQPEAPKVEQLQGQEAAPSEKPQTFAQTGAAIAGSIFGTIALSAMSVLGYLGFKKKQ